MRKFFNYFLSFFALSTMLFLASCGEDGELPIPGDSEIDLSTDDGAIDGDTLRAAPGETINITASLGVGSSADITVTTNDASVVEVPTPNTITSGSSIAVTIPADATVGAMATLNFVSDDVNDQLTVVIGYGNVIQAAETTDELSTFVEAVEAAGLTETLMGDGPFTVFAPSNAAFEDLLGSLGITLEELIGGEDLESILLYHVVDGTAYASTDLEDGTELTTAHPDGLTSLVSNDGTTIMINGATVTTADIVTDNGTVHIIDEVLMPNTVASYQTVLLESPTGDRASESFFSALDGMAYTANDVINGEDGTSANIDFGYYFGASNNASLASPSVYPSAVYNLGSTGFNWGTLNETMFVPVNNFTSDDFDGITDSQAYRLAQEYELGSAGTDPTAQINQLEVGGIYAFMTARGQYGILRVDDLNGTADSNGSITLSVKVTNE